MTTAPIRSDAAVERLLGKITGEENQTLLPPSGMVQTRSSYQTAIQVIRPRVLAEIERRCLEEARIAGDGFYYAWKQGSEFVEGITIGAAQAMARNWGNCAVEVRVTETPSAYIFEGVFIDLETGYNLVRPFRQNRNSPKKKDGSDTYKGERGADIIFQIGASKAMRNAILNVVPKWLSDKVMSTAKENVRDKIEKMGPEKAKGIIFKKSEAFGISAARVENQYGNESSWDTENIIRIMSALRAIEDGVEKASELFPHLPEDENQSIIPADVKKEEAAKPEPQKAEEKKEESPNEPEPLENAAFQKVIEGLKGKVSHNDYVGVLTAFNVSNEVEVPIAKRNSFLIQLNKLINAKKKASAK